MSMLLEKLLGSEKLRPEGVIHAGAEWAQEAPLYDRAGVKNVLWLEASSENIGHRETAKNLGPYGTNGRQKLVHGAVWHRDGEILPFHWYNARSSNSLFTNDRMQVYYPRHQPVHTEFVPTITLDAAVRKHWNWTQSRPNLLVMDLQGAELHALAGAASLLFSDELTYVCTEAMTEPLYKGGAQLDQLDAMLIGVYGFRRVAQERHEVSIWYKEIGQAIEEGRLPPIPQFDVLYQR